LYTITVLILAINYAIEFLSTASTILHASGILTLCPLNATLLINELTNAMILSGVDLYSEVYQEFLLLRQFLFRQSIMPAGTNSLFVFSSEYPY
jgi:hypothetical protein